MIAEMLGVFCYMMATYMFAMAYVYDNRPTVFRIRCIFIGLAGVCFGTYWFFGGLLPLAGFAFLGINWILEHKY